MDIFDQIASAPQQPDVFDQVQQDEQAQSASAIRSMASRSDAPLTPGYASTSGATLSRFAPPSAPTNADQAAEAAGGGGYKLVPNAPARTIGDLARQQQHLEPVTPTLAQPGRPVAPAPTDESLSRAVLGPPALSDQQQAQWTKSLTDEWNDTPEGKLDNAVAGGPVSMYGGAKSLDEGIVEGDKGKVLRGATGLVGGAGQTMAVAAAPELAELGPAVAAGDKGAQLALAKLIAGIETGNVGAATANYAARRMGFSQDAQDLAATIGFFLPSAAGMLAGVRATAFDGENMKGAGVSMFGGKVQAGVGSTPEEVGAGVRVGGKQVSMTVPRQAPPDPVRVVAQQQLESTVSALTEKQRTEAASAAIAKGVPPAQAVSAVTPKPPQPPMPSGMEKGIIQPRVISDLAQTIAMARPEDRPGLVMEAHQQLAKWMAQQGGRVMIGDEIHLIKNPDQAAQLAAKLVNAEVARQDEARNQAAQAQQKPAQQPAKPAEPQNPNEPATDPQERLYQRAQTLLESTDKPSLQLLQRNLRITGGQAKDLFARWQQEKAEASLPTVGDKAEPVVEESRATVDAQMAALTKGTTNVVMLPQGSGYKPQVPDGFKAMDVKKGPGAGTYIYNQQAVKPSTIRRAAENGTHGDLLGHIQSKEELAGKPTAVVQASAADGTPIQDSEVNPADAQAVHAQAQVLAERHPGAQISVKPTDQVVGERRAAQQREAQGGDVFDEAVKGDVFDEAQPGETKYPPATEEQVTPSTAGSMKQEDRDRLSWLAADYERGATVAGSASDQALARSVLGLTKEQWNHLHDSQRAMRLRDFLEAREPVTHEQPERPGEPAGAVATGASEHSNRIEEELGESLVRRLDEYYVARKYQPGDPFFKAFPTPESYLASKTRWKRSSPAELKALVQKYEEMDAFQDSQMEGGRGESPEPVSGGESRPASVAAKGVEATEEAARRVSPEIAALPEEKQREAAGRDVQAQKDQQAELLKFLGKDAAEEYAHANPDARALIEEIFREERASKGGNDADTGENRPAPGKGAETESRVAGAGSQHPREGWAEEPAAGGPEPALQQRGSEPAERTNAGGVKTGVAAVRELRTGTIIRFEKIPRGSYLSTDEDFRVDIRKDGSVGFTSTKTGAGTWERAAMMATGEWRVVSEPEAPKASAKAPRAATGDTVRFVDKQGNERTGTVAHANALIARVKTDDGKEYTVSQKKVLGPSTSFAEGTGASEGADDVTLARNAGDGAATDERVRFLDKSGNELTGTIVKKTALVNTIRTDDGAQHVVASRRVIGPDVSNATARRGGGNAWEGFDRDLFERAAKRDVLANAAFAKIRVVEPAGQNHLPMLEVNADAYHLFNKLLGGRDWRGWTISGDLGSLRAFFNLAAQIDAHGSAPSRIAQFRDSIMPHLGDVVILVRPGYSEQTATEEQFHAWEMSKGVLTPAVVDAVVADPNFNSITEYLRRTGYPEIDKMAAVREAVAKIASGELQRKAHLPEAASNELLRSFFLAVASRHGVASLKKLPDVGANVAAIAKEVVDGHTQSEHPPERTEEDRGSPLAATGSGSVREDTIPHQSNEPAGRSGAEGSERPGSGPETARSSIARAGGQPDEVSGEANSSENREPWQMTRAEYHRSMRGQRVEHFYYSRTGELQQRHDHAVLSALQAGKNVPEPVLREIVHDNPYTDDAKYILARHPELAPAGIGLHYLHGGIGAVVPVDAIKRAAKPVANLIGLTGRVEALREEYDKVRASRDLQDSLYTLDAQANADVLRAKQLMEEAPGTAADNEALYHHIEDPTLPLTPTQRQLLDEYVAPLMRDTAEKVALMREDGATIDNYIHRIVKGRGNFIDRLMAGSKATGKGNVLRKNVPSERSRTMMALESNAGNRVVVSLKGDRVTAFRHGRDPEDMGSLSDGMTTRLEQLDQRLEPIVNEILKTQGDIKDVEEQDREEYLSKLRERIDQMKRDRDLIGEIKGRVPGQKSVHGVEVSFNKRASLSRQIERAEKELEAYDRGDAEVQLSTRAKEKTRRLNETLTVLKNQRGRLLEQVPTEHMADRVWQDKGGKTWKLTQATTKEIEGVTNLQYYHSALGSAIINWLAVEKQFRAVEFLKALTERPDFPRIGVKAEGGRPAPEGWRATQLPQLRGYYFEPHIAEVLDWYSDRLKAREPGIFERVNDFLVSSIFFNPLLHIPNILNHWAVEKGISGWIDPRTKVAQARAMVRAINAVIHQNDDFLAALDAGAPLQSQQFGTHEYARIFLEKMQQQIEAQPGAWQRVAKYLGYANPLKLLDAMKAFSGRVTWYSNDIAFLQAAYEKVDRGMTLKAALSETAKHIPDYRLPTRILDSAGLAKVLANRNIAMFMHYHYGALKSYGEVLKSLGGVGWEEEGENPKGEATDAAGRTRDQERAHALDILAMLGLVTFAVYPAIDKLLRSLTGNDDATIRRAGASTLPFNLLQMAQGEKSPADVAQSIVTPGVALKAAVELGSNVDLHSGRHLYTWPIRSAKTFAGQVESRLAESFGPADEIGRAGREGWIRDLAGMVGITFPEHGAMKIASEIAAAKADREALTPQDRDHLEARYAAIDALRAGKTQDAYRFMAKAQLTPRQRHNLVREAQENPLLAKVHNFNVDELQEVYDHATPEERIAIGPLLRAKMRKEKSAQMAVQTEASDGG